MVEPSQLEDVELDNDPSTSRGPVRIVEHGTKKLRNKVVKLVRVQWGNDPAESTWEPEEMIRDSHPELFSGMFLSWILLLDVGLDARLDA